MTSKRQANFELLRIVAMLMIIALHYIVKGYGTPEAYGYTPVYCAAGLIEAFCIVAVDCYVLISGYFLVESEWKAGRIVTLLLQVLFYSLLIPLLMLCFGMVSPGDLGLYDWLGFVFPIGTEHYWFASAYIIMYIFAPVLAAGVKKMSRKALGTVIIFLLLFFSVEKTFIPIAFVTDRYGYDYGWFLCLFLVAAYLRLYCPVWLNNKRNALLLYTGMSLCVFALSAVCALLGEKAEAFAYYSQMPYTYNHLLCLFGAVGLFCAFKNTKIREGKMADTIRRFAPYTFGIYLLHEHILIRNEWPDWLRIDAVRGTWKFLWHLPFCVIVIYVSGTLADFIRAYLFERIRRLRLKNNR